MKQIKDRGYTGERSGLHEGWRPAGFRKFFSGKYLPMVLIAFVQIMLLPVFNGSGLATAEETPPPLAADLVEDGQAIDLQSPRYKELFTELRQRHKFTQEELDGLFTGVTVKKRVLELMDSQWEAKPYYEYYPRFITWKATRQGKKMLEKHKEVLDRIEREIGVEREIVVAIWGIESQFGEHKGAFNMFQTLNTMFDAYPRRRDFYRQELISYLVLCRENGVSPREITGSYGGAFGQTQFIPSSFLAYAVDFDRDGRRDVWNSVPDVLASIANYLHSFDWTLGMPIYCELGEKLKDQRLVEAYEKGRRGLVPWKLVKDLQQVTMPALPENKEVTIVGLELDGNGRTRYVAGYPNFQAITKWNNSNRYAMAVTELAATFKENP